MTRTHAIVIEGFSRGFGVVGDSILLGFFRLLFDCECNCPSFFATVFFHAYAFNGDLNQWDVAQVTNMFVSESIRIVDFLMKFPFDQG